MFRYPLRWLAANLQHALGRVARPRRQALAPSCARAAETTALAAGCEILLAADVTGGAEVVRSTNGGTVTEEVAGGALMVTTAR